jgi:hypothetical protein
MPRYYLAMLRDLGLTLLLVALLVFHLFFSYVGAIQSFSNARHSPNARAPWCATTEGCISLPLEPLHSAVDVPGGKYQGDPGLLEEVAVNLLVNLLVASGVSALMHCVQ